MGPLRWKRQKQEGAWSRMDKPGNPWAPGTFILLQSEFPSKSLSASLSLAYRGVYLGKVVFCSVIYLFICLFGFGWNYYSYLCWLYTEI